MYCGDPNLKERSLMTQDISRTAPPAPEPATHDIALPTPRQSLEPSTHDGARPAAEAAPHADAASASPPARKSSAGWIVITVVAAAAAWAAGWLAGVAWAWRDMTPRYLRPMHRH
jgi:hypothetical protein